jgi:NADH-quinone oxidoreductase subunit N
VIASHAQVFAGSNRLFVMGLVLLLVGIGFKVSLVPFHAWTPDVYQGAPTSISAFMATGVKVVMFTLFLRLVDMQMFFADERIITGLSFIAVATMVFGNITALVQDNIKRIIAYSSIAHAGYILVGIVAALRSGDPEASSAVLFYVLSYSLMNLGAFAIVNMVEKEERGQLSITDYAGLGFKYPLLGVALSVFMLSLAGIPPTVGFIGKFYLFAAAYKTGFVWLAVLGVINSLLSVYYYLRVLVYLYMKEEVFSVRVDGTLASNFVVIATMAATLLVGIFSAPFLLKM